MDFTTLVCKSGSPALSMAALCLRYKTDFHNQASGKCKSLIPLDSSLQIYSNQLYANTGVAVFTINYSLADLIEN